MPWLQRPQTLVARYVVAFCRHHEGEQHDGDHHLVDVDSDRVPLSVIARGTAVPYYILLCLWYSSSKMMIMSTVLPMDSVPGYFIGTRTEDGMRTRL